MTVWAPVAVAVDVQEYAPWYGFVVSSPPPVMFASAGKVILLIPEPAEEVAPTVKPPVFGLVGL